MRKKTSYLLVLLSASLILAVPSCKKGSQPAPIEKKEEKEEPPIRAEVTLSTTEAVPGRIIECEFNSTALTKDTVHAILSGQTMILYRTEGNRFSGIVPVLPVGEHALRFHTVESARPMHLGITAYTPITRPETILSETLADLSAAITQLKALPIRENEPGSNYLEQLLSETSDLIAGLSEAEKTELAYLIAGNNPLQYLPPSGEQQPLRAGLLMSRNKKDAGDLLVDEALKLNQSVNLMIGSGLAAIGSAILLYKARNSYIAVFTGISMGIAIISGLTAVEKAEHVGRLEGVAGVILKFLNGESPQTQRLLMNLSAAPRLVLPKDESRFFNITMGYRTISTEDSNHPGAVIRQVIADNNELITLSRKIKEAIADVAEYLPSLKAFTAFEGALSTTTTLEEQEAPLDRISLSAASDPAIRLSHTTETGMLQITATSETIDAERAFTFDVIYRHEGLDITVRKTIEAVYDGRIPPPKLVIVGGNEQLGERGKKLFDPLQVQVTDVHGQPLQGIVVSWKVNQGGGTLSSTTSTTNADGVASVFWTIGNNAQAQEATAEVTGNDGKPAQGSPAVFSAQPAELFVGTWTIVGGTLQINSDPPQPYDFGSGTLQIRIDNLWRSNINEDNEDVALWGQYLFEKSYNRLRMNLLSGYTFYYRIKTMTAETLEFEEIEVFEGQTYTYTQRFKRAE